MANKTIKLKKRTDGERRAYMEGYNRGIADGRERKEGRWLPHEEGRWVYAKCDLCETVHDVKSHYCPNCGAKMESEVEK